MSLDRELARYPYYNKYICKILKQFPKELVNIISKYSFEYNSFKHFRNDNIKKVRFVGNDNEYIFFVNKTIKNCIIFYDVITKTC